MGVGKMAQTNSQDIWREFSCRTQDDLLLCGREYGNALSTKLPLVCLPGLTRSVRDFDALANYLGHHHEISRRIITLDYRGRGKSDYDKDWTNYTPLNEAYDVLAVTTALGLEDFILLGTSRGGIIAMLLGSLRPTVLAGVILHDIGPTIDLQGLIKIKNYLQRMPSPKNWQDATEILKSVHHSSFPNYQEEDWQKAARLTFKDDDGKPVFDFDVNLTKTLLSISADNPPPNLWPNFMSLSGKPVLTIRGALSDLLSSETLEMMDKTHPTMQKVTVENQGHVPNLMDEKALAAIEEFLKSVDEHNG